jgi:catechol 2,3-dioxygenase-like lactoylglutathione lyase family enzyme
MADLKIPQANKASPFADVRGHHVAVRVPDRAEALKWYTEKLDWRVVHLWPFADEELAYIAPPNDDTFMVELLAGGNPGPLAAPAYSDLGESLRHAGYHHFCLMVDNIDVTIAEFRKRGVKIVTEPFQLDDISRKLAFIADPFGNLIELAEVIA